MQCIINEHTSLKHQLLWSFGVTALISGGVTLGICIGMLRALGSSSYDSADNIILRNTRSNAQNLGSEIAVAIDQQLSAVSESVVAVSATFASVLLSSGYRNSPPVTRLKDQPSFREFHFLSNCSYPKCPEDFGPISPRSRLPYLTGYENGSIDHTSVFMYSSTAGRAIRNDQEFDSILNASQPVRTVQDLLAVQDFDLKTMYQRGPNSTVLFYLSAGIYPSYASTATPSYVALHRTYPGLLKDEELYDPTRRPWFVNAPDDGINMFGPYRETFTNQYSLTLSRASSAVYIANSGIKVVAAAVVLLQDLEIIVNRISYPDNGFGAVVLYKSYDPTVLVWGRRQDLFDEANNRFRTVSYFDPILAQENLLANKALEYEDQHGVEWIVTSQGFFESGNNGKPQLIMLVFAQKSEAAKPLDSLQSNIDDTDETVTIATVIIICATVGGVLLLTILLVLYVTAPLETMRLLSGELVKISAEPEEIRDYSTVLQKAYFNLQRTDEVGLLACDFYHVVAILNAKNLEKKSIPKYPENLFYLSQSNKELTWQLAQTQLNDKLGIDIAGVQGSEIAVECVPKHHDDLDVLASLSAAGTASLSAPTNTYKKVHISAPTTPVTDQQVEVKERRCWTSLTTQLYAISCFLLAGLIIAMVITIVTLVDEGASWADDTGNDVAAKQIDNLQSIAVTKATFVASFFAQLSLDLLIGAQFATRLLDGNLTRSFWESNKDYLPSYSIDFYNPYVYRPSYSDDVSGYFKASDAGCRGSTCANTRNASTTRLTSLLDLKMRSYFYDGSILSFLQIGLDDEGFTRYWPYNVTKTNSRPTSCLVTTTYSSLCDNLFYNSRCFSNAYLNYPPYEARCRTWYELGETKDDPNNVFFQYPRVSSSGSYVVTGVIALRAQADRNGAFYGVLNSNFLANTLSSAINSLKILSSGYSYLLDSTSPQTIIVHPKAKRGCGDIFCAEDFSDAETDQFNRTVLQVIQRGDYAALPTTYRKNGEEWQLLTQPVREGSIDYTLVLTVPKSEVYETSNETQDSIDYTTAVMIAVFVIVIVVFFVILLRFTRILVRSIVAPVCDLRDVFQHVKGDNLSVNVPTTASSSDLRVLLVALSRLLIALRFGSDSYAKGDLKRAKELFTEALNMFQATRNQRGIGASLNNLAAVELALGNISAAESLYAQAIENGREMLAEADKQQLAEDVNKALRVISDREGNLALVYLQNNQFSAAFSLLERLLQEDKALMYIRGCVVKQGHLGQYYLKQGEVQSAERTFASVLSFVQTNRANVNNANEALLHDWGLEELHATEQIALFNMASLHLTEHQLAQTDAERRALFVKAEAKLLEALTSPLYMHKPTCKSILQSLLQLYTNEKQLEEAVGWVRSLASAAGIIVEKAGKAAPTRKRVYFSIDYSGSMSGTKIRSAINNMRSLVDNHIRDHDAVGINVFNDAVREYWPLTEITAENRESIQQSIAALGSPGGCTAFYDGVHQAMHTLSSVAPSPPASDWIVALTDGEDNRSKCTLDKLCTELQRSNIGVIVIGVGSDVRTDLLQRVAKAAEKGEYVFAEGNQQSIDEAFGRVAEIIQQGQVVMEEY